MNRPSRAGRSPPLPASTRFFPFSLIPMIRRMASKVALSFETFRQIDSTVIGPRLGLLSLPVRKTLQTPSFIAVSSRGVIPHLSPDVISAHSEIGGVHMALEDFIEKARKETPPLVNYQASSPLHGFTSLPESLFTVLAPRRTPAVVAPLGNSNKAISLFTNTGFQTLTNGECTAYINATRPDIAIPLADIAYGSIPGVKRIDKMADRTCKWVAECLSEKRQGQAIFAPVLPLNYSSQFEYLSYLTDEVADQISGLAFYDSNLLPDIPATTAMVKLPRLSLDEPSSPSQVLRQISLGMDIFTIPFIGHATDGGIALAFEFPQPHTKDGAFMVNEGSPKSLGLDMWGVEHSTSLLPLYSGCECYACTSHHRAYIQHLLSAKEMLGWVLLQIHNHHIMTGFFADVRVSIERGTFERDCETFARAYESELPEKTGQGPRARGYHRKAEGPGEDKINKKAWGNLGGTEALEQKGFAEKAT